MKKVQILLGSTRQGRMSEKVGQWVLRDTVPVYPAVEFSLVDLRDYPLPFYNEPRSPKLIKGNYQSDVAKQWSAKIKEANAYIIVTPEYNHGYPAVLKNALDYLYEEWNNKPVGFVSYGGASGGIRAVEQLKLVANELQMVLIRDEVHIPAIRQAFDDEGRLTNEEIHQANLKAIMEKLLSLIA